MLRYIYANDLHQHKRLADSMFLDRACQFRDRLGWDVTVDTHGQERDEYDGLNPLYVIWEGSNGLHRGSMRFLPTTGRTMINEHFTDILGGGTIVSPLIWECTRFCLSRGAESRIAAALMLGGGELMRHFGVAHFAGVFDARMVRIYRMIGSSPEILGSQGEGLNQISVGLWEFTEDARRQVSRRAKVSPALSDLWFRRSFGFPVQRMAEIA
ncbi:MAG: acyl-homoserine-lactone synthase [Pseudomonadota bacterium]